MATHSSTLAWKIPWIGEPGRLVYGVAKSRTRLSNTHTHTHTHTQTHDSGIEFALLIMLIMVADLSLWSGKVKCKSLNHVPLFMIPWTVHATEFSRPEYWSGWPFLSPGDLPDPGIELTSLKPPALAGGFLITSATWESQCTRCLKNWKMKTACEIPLYGAITHHLFPSNSKFKPFSFRYPKISDRHFPHTHSVSSSDP